MDTSKVIDSLPNDKLLSNKDLMQKTGLGKKALASFRKNGLSYFHVGTEIRYEPADVKEYLKAFYVTKKKITSKAA